MWWTVAGVFNMYLKMTKIKIGSRIISQNHKVFIIAEAGVNHNGRLDVALRLIDEASKAGADAIKFQTFTPELLVSKTARQAEYQTRNTKKKETQLAMLRNLNLSRKYYPLIQNRCIEKGLIFLSTPYSEADADFLEKLSVPAYKISSGDITNLPFLEHVAKKGKPVIISTGAADFIEVKQALQVIRQTRNKQIVVLHSTSNYPPSSASLNLRIITTFWRQLKRYGVLVGYSDNGSKGMNADVIATALGACIIEKHFTLDKNMAGPDHKASLSTLELKRLVEAIRETEIMLGSYKKKCTPEEKSSRILGRRSIFSRHLIHKGSILTKEDLIMKRPGIGISPKWLNKVIGKKIRVDIPADVIIKK